MYRAVILHFIYVIYNIYTHNIALREHFPKFAQIRSFKLFKKPPQQCTFWSSGNPQSGHNVQ